MLGGDGPLADDGSVDDTALFNNDVTADARSDDDPGFVRALPPTFMLLPVPFMEVAAADAGC